jgi:hypothetical protein
MKQQDYQFYEAVNKGPWLSKNAKTNLIRGLYMLLYFLVMYVVWIVLFFISVLQFVLKMIWKKYNANLLTLGENLSHYSYEVFQFLTCNTEQLPYPFSAWPTTTKNKRDKYSLSDQNYFEGDEKNNIL